MYRQYVASVITVMSALRYILVEKVTNNCLSHQAITHHL